MNYRETIRQTAAAVFKQQLSKQDGLMRIESALRSFAIERAKETLKNKSKLNKAISRIAPRLKDRMKVIAKAFDQPSAVDNDVHNEIKAAKKKKSKLTADERAEMMSDYETRRADSYGKGAAWWADERGGGKRWVTMSPNSCEDCQENEDQGPIELDDVYESGDDEPPMHPGCICEQEYVNEEDMEEAGY